MNPRLQRQEGIARVAHLEDAPEAILGDVPYLQYLQLRRYGTQVELRHEDIVHDDGRLGRLVQRRRQEVARALVEICVGRERRPVEVEGHVERLRLLGDRIQ